MAFGVTVTLAPEDSAQQRAGLSRRVGHQDPDRTRVGCSLLQHGSARVRDVQERKPGPRRVAFQYGCAEDLLGKGAVAARHQVFDPVLPEDPVGVPGDRLHQRIRLVGAAPGEPLLGPAARSSPGLDVAGAGFRGQRGAVTDRRH
ncbi:hypothetical protein D9M72_567170 [compost metagenome]